MFEILMLQQQVTVIKPSYEEMISAGLTMGFIGYLMTFITLTILASIIWIVSKATPISKHLSKATITIPHEIIAAAIAAVRAYILSKKKARTPPSPKYLKWRELGWFRYARLSHMETLERYESERRKRKGSLE